MTTTSQTKTATGIGRETRVPHLSRISDYLVAACNAVNGVISDVDKRGINCKEPQKYRIANSLKEFRFAVFAQVAERVVFVCDVICHQLGAAKCCCVGPTKCIICAAHKKKEDGRNPDRDQHNEEKRDRQGQHVRPGIAIDPEHQCMSSVHLEAGASMEMSGVTHE